MSKPINQSLSSALFPDFQVKIWSLVVTVFGDLAAQEHDTLSGTQLKALFDVMSIKPDALRVALHRLSKEDWIISQRVGRHSHYRLSDFGLSETRKVWHQVYRPVHETKRQWHIAVMENSLPKSNSRGIKLAAQTYIVDNNVLLENTEAISFPFPSTNIPGWIEEKILADGVDEQSAALLSAFNKIPKLILKASDIEKVAIRTLCLHQWRRMMLRDAPALHLQYFEDGQTRQCHDNIHRLLDDIPRSVAVDTLNMFS